MTIASHTRNVIGCAYSITRPGDDSHWTAALAWIVHEVGKCQGNLAIGVGPTPAAALIAACGGSRKFRRGEHADTIEAWATEAAEWKEGTP